ncbi:MAG: hypothetical protein F2692_00055 [Actinobacteria bacterium]|nr:hypothetical protein [Actinomycetota bacterium]
MVTTVEGLFSPDGERIGARLLLVLADPAWSQLTAAVAFVKMSGVRQIAQPLIDFGTSHPGGISITVGIDHGGSSVEAVSALHTIVEASGGRLFIAHNPARPKATFHPKLWLFGAASDDRLLIVGSGNLTGGGLFSNYEAGVAVSGVATDPLMISAQAFLDQLSTVPSDEVILATPASLQRLHDQGDLPSENESRRILVTSESLRRSRRSFLKHLPLFRGRSVASPPRTPMPTLPASPVIIAPAPSLAPPAGPSAPVPPASHAAPAVASPVPSGVSTATGPLHRFFFITVRMANKTEVYLAKRPLGEDPAFFGAPFRGLTTPKHPTTIPQPQADPAPLVRITIHTSPSWVLDNHELKLWTYTFGPSANDDFRTNLTAPAHALIPEDSVMRIERDPVSRPDLAFEIEVFPPTHPDYPAMRAACTIALPGGQRFYGWQ